MDDRAKKKAWVRHEHDLVVGVDIAKKKHWACVTDSDGEKRLKPFAFKNSREGFKRLQEQIQRFHPQIAPHRVVVGMEPSGHYWKPLAHYLQQAGFHIVLTNPFHVKSSKELSDNSPTKNDRKDAGVIAELVQEGRFLRCYLPEGVYAELRVLTMTRQQQKLNAALNGLQAILDEHFPEFTEVFADPLGKAAQYVLRHCPFPVDVQAWSQQDLAAALKLATRQRVGEKRAASLLAAAARSIGVQSGLQGARLKLRSCLAEIAFWHEQMEQTEAAMKQALEQTGLAPYLLSIPGVGVVTAASFLGEVGDLGRYEHWKQIQKLAGYNLTENSSGQRTGQTRISKRGRPGLRSLLYQAALILVSKNREFKALYQHFLTRPVNRLQRKQALVAVALKLLRVLYTLGKEKRHYDACRVLGSYRRQQLALNAA